MPLTQTITTFDVQIPTTSLAGTAGQLPGRLCLPESAIGLVLFAHGSGSSRRSPRNSHVAGVLHEGWIGTLLFDLLTEQEATDRVNVFDIGLLADRLGDAIRFVRECEQTAGLPLGLFGASTGAAAAIVAAAADADIAAVVSRGGRPDLAGTALRRLRTPTLLIVGGHDPQVLALNEAALGELPGPKRMAIVPGATHLFEEPGTLDEVARLASEWFGRHLRG
jgi:Dipeptidyl aminopeptidases/acylaminoacyl-peptidases